MKRLSTFSLALIAFTGAAQFAQALPRNANGTVINGTASIVDTSGTVTTINQSSDIAEINWTDFDIASGEMVQFNVPRAESVTINRVTSGLQSTIAGTINSNGQVYLINEHGIRFTDAATFNMPTFVASTIDTFNVQADANQYAQIVFDSIASSPGSVDKFVVISPFVGFYTTGSNLNLNSYKHKEIYSANRATVNYAGADNTLSVDVPDAQPDVVVPGGEKLGIEAIVTAATINLYGYDLKMVAKAVSVAQNIDALINLNGDEANNRYVFLQQYYNTNDEAQAGDYELDIYTSGHLYVGEHVSLGYNVYDTNTVNATTYLESDIKLVAGKNLFMKKFLRGANNMYVEAGDNLILNSGKYNIESSVVYGIYGARTIKLGNGTLNVESTEVDFDTLADISTYAPGTIGHVTDYWVAKQDYTKPADVSFYTYHGPSGNVAVDTTLEAPNININTAIDLTGSITESAFKDNLEIGIGAHIFTYFAKAIEGDGNGNTAPLNLISSGDVNINANIDMAGMGDLNVTAVNYNINGGSTVTGATAETLTAYVPPAPPIPPAPPPAPDPDPAPVVPPVVEASPTFEELMTETLTPERIELVKEVFFESFSQGAKEVVAQISNVEPVAESKQSVPAVKRSEFVAKQDLAENIEPTAVAAACSDGICTVLDKNDSLQIVDESYLNRYKKGLQNIVDKVVNLKGVTDITRF